VMIWSKSLCVRRGGLTGEEGGFCRRAGGCGGGVVDPLFLRSDVLTLGSRVVVVWPGGSLGSVGGVGGRDVSVRIKVSRPATPPSCASKSTTSTSSIATGPIPRRPSLKPAARSTTSSPKAKFSIGAPANGAPCNSRKLSGSAPRTASTPPSPSSPNTTCFTAPASKGNTPRSSAITASAPRSGRPSRAVCSLANTTPASRKIPA
jgi:hypothetical protein